MEFLGDAILQLVISNELYSLHLNHDEGTLTKARAGLVNGNTLAKKASQLGLENHLVISIADQSQFERGKKTALEDAFEAITAALFLDGGLESVRPFIRRVFAEELKNPDFIASIKNPKVELQELLQGQFGEPPKYVDLSTGPIHNRKFEVSAQHLGKELSKGTGNSKKEAESNAALAALTKIQESGSKSNPISTAGAECVKAPMEI